MPDTRTLLETIQSLLADRIAEIEDFVAFIVAREQSVRLAVPLPREVSRPLLPFGIIRKTPLTMPFSFGDQVKHAIGAVLG